MGSSATTLASGAPNLGNQPVAHAANRGYNVAIGYLRGFLVILVLAHHSAVAYFWGVPTSRAPLPKTPMLWRGFPVVDPHSHSALLTLFVSFNDTFFMALMFFSTGVLAELISRVYFESQRKSIYTVREIRHGSQSWRGRPGRPVIPRE